MTDRSRRLLAALVLTLCAAAPAPAPSPNPDDTKSALETDAGGWVDLLKDSDPDPTQSGWTREPIPVQSNGVSRESPWSFDGKTGVLSCRADRSGHEWLRWDEPMGDAIVHVEWRFVPVEQGKPDKYNAGMYVRNSADGVIWHQAQMGGGSGGWLFGETLVGKFMKRIDLSKTVTDKRVKPAGEWNTFEVTARGRDVSVWANGAVVCRWDACEIPRGYLGLEAEGYAIEFRNVRMKSFDLPVPGPPKT